MKALMLMLIICASTLVNATSLPNKIPNCQSRVQLYYSSESVPIVPFPNDLELVTSFNVASAAECVGKIDTLTVEAACSIADFQNLYSTLKLVRMARADRIYTDSQGSSKLLRSKVTYCPQESWVWAN